MSLKLVRSETLKGQALENIKNLMMTGQLRLNEVYSSNYFANILGISRTPAREALLQLTYEGYFEAKVNKGFKIRQFTKTQIRDLFETRMVIETYVIGKIAEKHTQTIEKKLNLILDQMIELADAQEARQFLAADKRFHMLLIDKHSNRHFYSIMDNIRNLIMIMGGRALMNSGRSQEVIHEHKAIVKALKNKDIPKAIETMKAHIHSTEQSVLANQRSADV